MRQYSKDPKYAAPVFSLKGTNVDGAPVELRVTFSSGTLYTTWIRDGFTVYRRQYSGRNVKTLQTQIDELLAGLIDPTTTGSRDFSA